MTPTGGPTVRVRHLAALVLAASSAAGDVPAGMPPRLRRRQRARKSDRRQLERRVSPAGAAQLVHRRAHRRRSPRLSRPRSSWTGRTRTLRVPDRGRRRSVHVGRRAERRRPMRPCSRKLVFRRCGSRTPSIGVRDREAGQPTRIGRPRRHCWTDRQTSASGTATSLLRWRTLRTAEDCSAPCPAVVLIHGSGPGERDARLPADECVLRGTRVRGAARTTSAAAARPAATGKPWTSTRWPPTRVAGIARG